MGAGNDLRKVSQLDCQLACAEESLCTHASCRLDLTECSLTSTGNKKCQCDSCHILTKCDVRRMSSARASIMQFGRNEQRLHRTPRSKIHQTSSLLESTS